MIVINKNISDKKQQIIALKLNCSHPCAVAKAIPLVSYVKSISFTFIKHLHKFCDLPFSTLDFYKGRIKNNCAKSY